eukprot:scaffold183097_cov43-Prasinocladus_malaysianus.AAC.1
MTERHGANRWQQSFQTTTLAFRSEGISSTPVVYTPHQSHPGNDAIHYMSGTGPILSQEAAAMLKSGAVAMVFNNLQ